jgi:hypothetical protein
MAQCMMVVVCPFSILPEVSMDITRIPTDDSDADEYGRSGELTQEANASSSVNQHVLRNGELFALGE